MGHGCWSLGVGDIPGPILKGCRHLDPHLWGTDAGVCGVRGLGEVLGPTLMGHGRLDPHLWVPNTWVPPPSPFFCPPDPCPCP